MPLPVDANLPTNFPTPNYLTLGNFKRGVISLIDKSRLPKDALEQADNIFLVEDGQPSLRPGVDWFGAAAPNGEPIDGFSYFDYSGVIHLVIVAGGTVYRSTDDGTTWDTCTGATLTADLPTEMNQYNSYLYLTNGTDNITLYDGTTVLTQYTTLATPAAPSAVETALSGAGINYYYKVSRVNTVGFSVASPVNTGTVSTNLDRSNWVAGTNYVTLTTPVSVTGQTRWDIYLSEDNVNFYYLSSVASGAVGATADFVDDGTAIPVPSTIAPTDSTAQGPPVKELVNVGSRMYGIRDTANPYRIWFSSGSPPVGAFSSAYDGGYLDWSPGGKYIPMQVVDYRDGKGTPLATVFCKSADGQGCVLQMSLDLFTVGDISITIPSAYKLPGSRGTPAPGSLVNVLNDYMFYNSQAFYNLGSRAQFLNLLSTDEASANIRPSVKAISTSGEENIASVYFDAKVYFSVGIGSSTNNTTMVFDTERKAWLPSAFTLGFKKFLRYTTTGNSPKLLALKPGDTQLSEISTSIQGDYGVAFTSTLMTGLYPVTKNRFEFQWTEQGEVEFSNPTGEINIELIGLERGRGFSSQGSATINSTLSTTGWDTFLWDSTLWDDTSTAIDTFSESTVKRYFRLGRELNAVQWKVTTNSLDAGYVLRTLQTWGTQTGGGMPRSWRLNVN
jgi:hypothetical protein